MTTEAPRIDLLDETTWPVIEVDVFKCCVHDGKYLGDELVHDPSVPGDGPWLLVVRKNGISLTFGFGTKLEAVRASRSLTQDAGYQYEIDIDELED